MGRVCTEDAWAGNVSISGSLNMPMGGVCACEAKANIDAEVDRVCTGSSSNADLHVAHRGTRVKAR